MSKMNLRRAMLLKLSDEKDDLRNNISNLNRVLQDHLKLEQRIRHLPKDKFEEILNNNEDLVKDLEKFQRDMEELENAKRPKSKG